MRGEIFGLRRRCTIQQLSMRAVPCKQLSARACPQASGRRQRLEVRALFNVGGLGVGDKEVYVTGTRMPNATPVTLEQ